MMTTSFSKETQHQDDLTIQEEHQPHYIPLINAGKSQLDYALSDLNMNNQHQYYSQHDSLDQQQDEIDKALELLNGPDLQQSQQHQHYQQQHYQHQQPHTQHQQPGSARPDILLFEPDSNLPQNTTFTSMPNLTAGLSSASSGGSVYGSVPHLTVNFEDPAFQQPQYGWRDAAVDDSRSSIYSGESDNESLSATSDVPPALDPSQFDNNGVDTAAPFLQIPARVSRRSSSNSLSGFQDLSISVDDMSDDGYLTPSQYDPSMVNVVQLSSPMIHAIPSPNSSPALGPTSSPLPAAAYSPSQYLSYSTNPAPLELPATAITQFLDLGALSPPDAYSNLTQDQLAALQYQQRQRQLLLYQQQLAQSMVTHKAGIEANANQVQHTLSFDDLMVEFQEYEESVSPTQTYQQDPSAHNQQQQQQQQQPLYTYNPQIPGHFAPTSLLLGTQSPKEHSLSPQFHSPASSVAPSREASVEANAGSAYRHHSPKRPPLHHTLTSSSTSSSSSGLLEPPLIDSTGKFISSTSGSDSSPVSTGNLPPRDRRGSPVPADPSMPPLPKPSQMAVKTSTQTLYQCPYPGCGKTFTRPYNLKSHYRSHTGERPFVCEHCPVTFSRKHDLKRHMKLHVGLKPYICIACQKAFARSDALRRHLKTGDSGKESPCSIKINEVNAAKQKQERGNSEVEIKMEEYDPVDAFIRGLEAQHGGGGGRDRPSDDEIGEEDGDGMTE